jgi:AcrR family transcriptional regulator
MTVLTRMTTELKPERRVAIASQAPSPAGASARVGANKKAEQRQVSIDTLLDAALRLFVSQGFRSTNLEQISGAAKLTKGAVYFYFRSKEVVLLELLKRVQHIVVDEAIKAVAQAEGGPTDRLVAYVHYQASLGITHRDEVLLLILMSLEYKERDGEVRAFIRTLYERQRAFMSALIHEGQATGEFRGDVPTRELAAIVLAMNDGTFLEWFRRSEDLDGASLVRALRTTVLGGVVQQRVSGPTSKKRVDPPATARKP